MSALPHDPYIDAVRNALDEAGLEVADGWTSDAETQGVYCYLSAVLTLDTKTSGLDPERWPNGLILIWEWHTGIEADQGEPERGPYWQWAEKTTSPGWNEPPQQLPVPGWVAPEMLAAAVASLVHTGTPFPMGSLWHDHLRQPVEAAIEAWAADEEASANG